MMRDVVGPPRPTRWLMLACLLAIDSASAADRFVSTAGSDAGNDCLAAAAPCRTIANAQSQSASGDTIKVALGTYRENLVIDASGTLTIAGGWTGDFAAQDPTVNVTQVNGGGLDRVFHVAADAGEVIDLSLDGLTIKRGVSGYGGGMLAQTSGDGAITLTISRSIMRNNRAALAGPSIGGGMYVASPAPGSIDLSIIDSIIRNNHAVFSGGINITGVVDASFVNTTFRQNRGSGIGNGAMEISTAGGAVSLLGCIIEKNSSVSSYDGESAFAYSCGPCSTLQITDTLVTRNRGGGVEISSFGGLIASITNSFIGLNRANEGVGGLYARAYSGGSIDLTTVNTTIVRNDKWGLSLAGPGSITTDLSNAILWDNETSDLSLDSGVTVNADHDDIGVVSAGAGTFNDLGNNISTDPLLVRRDVHLTPGSPAVDAGTCIGAPATDFEGDSRPSGGGCDMGADEFVP